MFQSLTSPVIQGPLPPSLVWLEEITTDFPWVAWATHSTPTFGYHDLGLIPLDLTFLVKVRSEEAAGVTGGEGLEGSEDFSET